MMAGISAPVAEVLVASSRFVRNPLTLALFATFITVFVGGNYICDQCGWLSPEESKRALAATSPFYLFSGALISSLSDSNEEIQEFCDATGIPYSMYFESADRSGPKKPSKLNIVLVVTMAPGLLIYDTLSKHDYKVEYRTTTSTVNKDNNTLLSVTTDTNQLIFQLRMQNQSYVDLGV